MPLDLSKGSFHEVSAPLIPQSWKDHPVTWQKLIKGGFQSFQTMQEADKFPLRRREWGMLANIAGLFHVISDDLSKWNPAEKGYLSLNPAVSNQQYNIIYPFNFRIMNVTSYEVEQVTPLTDGFANAVQHIFLSGNQNSVITYEIFKWYP
jgi:hypothetical protein